MERDKLEQLVYEIGNMIGAVAADPTIRDFELRMVLRFLAKVVQVVDQAFQDVLAFLVELKYLTKEDLSSEQVQELRKQLDLLTSTSRYEEAEAICSRLYRLQVLFRSQSEPIIRHLEQPQEWQLVLQLMDDKEGYLIRLVRWVTENLGGMLANVEESTVPEINRVAAEQVEVIKTSLRELRELSSEIMGLSGHTGFLELTADRSALDERISITLGRGAVTMGDIFNMPGDFRGAILNIKSKLMDVSQIIDQIPNADDAAKNELKTLIDQLNEALQKAPPDKDEEAEAVAETAKMLVEQASAEKPNKTMVKITGEGLKQAAQHLAAVMPAVVAIAAQIVGAVLKFIG